MFGVFPYFLETPKYLEVSQMLGCFFFFDVPREIYTFQNAPHKKSPSPPKSIHPQNIDPFFGLNQGFGDVVSWRFCKIIMGDLDPMSGEFNWLGVGWVGWVGCWRGVDGTQEIWILPIRVPGTGGKGKKRMMVFVFFLEPWGGWDWFEIWNPFWDVSIFIFSVPALKDGWMTLQFNSDPPPARLCERSAQHSPSSVMLWLMFDSTEQCLEGVWMVGFEFCMVQLYIPTTVYAIRFS